MVIDIEIDAVEYTLPVELHGKILESDEFLGHYPPPFLCVFLSQYDKYNYILNLPDVNDFLSVPKEISDFLPNAGLSSDFWAILGFGGASL